MHVLMCKLYLMYFFTRSSLILSIENVKYIRILNKVKNSRLRLMKQNLPKTLNE